MEEKNIRQQVKNRRLRGLAVGVVVVVTAIGLAVYAYQEMHIPDVPLVQQMWASSGVDYSNTDSVAAVRTNDGAVRVYATAKWGDCIDVFDGMNGAFLKRVGRGGESPGEFRRPNGIVALHFKDRQQQATSQVSQSAQPQQIRQAIVVVERDGDRVQVLSLDCLPIGMIGERIVRRPYGAAVSYLEEDPLLYVTDTDVTPDRTVSVFRLKRAGERVTGTLERQFGDVGAGRIHKAESIVVDDRFRRVLLCDEGKSQKDVKVYDLDGTYTGRTFGDGLVVGDPEGIVICESPKGGFVLLTDQRAKITIWHAFDRESLEFITSFSGETRIANTDGICLLTEPFRGHSAGAMFAVNDDTDIRAYDLEEIIRLVDGARAR